jgi:hypothetical protein
VTAAGIPTFVLGDRYVVGFTAGVTEERLRRLASDALAPAPGGDAAPSGEPPIIHVPVLGRLDVGQISLPAFTVIVGLVDGFNPCAMWVLLVLLSILVHVRSRRRLLLFGGLFVFVSGAVYFLFMVAWAALFRFAGLSQLLTMALGVVIVGMGLINLKELIWFRQGVSLTISDRAKPALYRRMRSIAAASSLPAAIVGTVVLAVVVNIVELACTVGLPAAYTRILSLRQVSDPVRYAYLALYNISYVVPLGVIVLTFSVTRSRITLRERGAKILKAVSGVVLVFFGLLLLLAPGWLGGA